MPFAEKNNLISKKINVEPRFLQLLSANKMKLDNLQEVIMLVDYLKITINTFHCYRHNSKINYLIINISQVFVLRSPKLHKKAMQLKFP